MNEVAMIFKYPLKITRTQTITLPEINMVIKVAEQNGELMLWALVDPVGEIKQAITIMIVGTGHPIDVKSMEEYAYFDTVLMSDGLVWHVFLQVGTNVPK